MEISVKEASLDNLDELMEWRMKVIQAVFGLENQEEYNYLYEKNQNYYFEALPSGDHIAVFAEIDGKKVGCGGICLYDEMPSPDNPSGKCAYLMNIFTPVEYRNQGVAREVVKYLTDKALDLGVGKIYLETTDKARKLYKNLNFIDLDNYMILENYDERDD